MIMIRFLLLPWRLLQRIVQGYLNIKILWKLIIGFGLIITSVFLIAAVGQLNIDKMNHVVETVIDGQLEPLVYLQDIRSYVGELEVLSRDALLQNDQTALNYLRQLYLPDTVNRTVEYSFEQLIENAVKSGVRSDDNWSMKMTASDRRMTEETASVLQELRTHWREYSKIYESLLETPGLYQDPEFKKQLNSLRYFLIGGIDRLVETYYRQQAVISKTEAVETYEQQKLMTKILLAGTILLALLVSFLTAGTIITPLNRLAQASRKIATGELEVNLTENRRDEFGEVIYCFNTMVRELNLLIMEISDAAYRVNENSIKLLSGTNTANSATEQLITTLSQVTVGAETQQKRVTLIHEIIRTVTEFSQAVNDFTHQIQLLSEESLTNAEKGNLVVNDIIQKMRNIQQFMYVSDEIMKQLNVASAEIDGMVGTVKEIAEQTNLLSLNASIEAARAGEHGRGFSIVAEAIGELSDRTSKATNQVKKLVSGVQEMYIKLFGIIQTENQAIKEGENAVAGLGDVFKSIDETTSQVNLELSRVTDYTIKLMEDQREVLRAIEQITNIAVEHKEGTERATSVAAEHFSFTQEIVAVSHLLAHWGDNLQQAIGKFKTAKQPELEKEVKKVS